MCNTRLLLVCWCAGTVVYISVFSQLQDMDVVPDLRTATYSIVKVISIVGNNTS